jgi:hypothetical protein
VLAALSRLGARAALLDLALVPRQGAVALGAGGPGPDLTLPSGEAVRAGEISAVWWRRPVAPVVHDGLSYAAGHHARLQWEAALHGFVAGLRCRLVNDPWREAKASHKPGQLAAAQRGGLLVPATLVTSDPTAASAFLDALGGPAVAKPLHGTDPTGWTGLVGPAERARLGALRTAPVILQAEVPGIDVRVTAVGARLFACAIDARATHSPQDFRPAYDDAQVEACRVPDAVAGPLRRLLDGLGLAFAAVDFRVREADGAWHFLEVNPAGQWLGFEARTGLPITQAVAELLAGAAA